MRITTMLLVVLVALQPLTGLAFTQRPTSPAEERDGWRHAARAMPPGATIKVELSSGRRVTGTLISVTEDGLLIKERGRQARPALMIPLADVARIERVTKRGSSIATAVAGGAAAGVGAFLTFLALLLMVSD